METLVAVIAGLFALLISSPAEMAAQATPEVVDARGGLVLDHYSFSDEEATGIRSLSLFTLPVSAAAPLGERLSVELRSAFARGSLERADGSSVDLSGLTDTELRVGFRRGGDMALQLQGIAMLPTGSSSQTPEEAQLAGAVAADLLPFRISNWGSGGGAGVHASVARSFGDTGAGLSASYVVGREFEPLEGEPFGYQPGDQLRIRGAVDHNVGPDARVALSLTLERFSDDAVDGTNLYRSGNRIQALASYAFAPTPRTSALAYGGVFHRSEGTALLDAAPAVPSQALLLAGGGVRVPMGWGVLVPSGDVRLFRTDDGVGQGWLTGVGLATEIPAAGHLVVPSVRARFGTVLVRDDVESGITGLELSFTARMGGGR